MANARARSEQIKAQGMTGTFKAGVSLAGSRTVRVANPETAVSRPSVMNIFGADGSQAPEQPKPQPQPQSQPQPESQLQANLTQQTAPMQQRGGPPMMGRGRARGGTPGGRVPPPMRAGPSAPVKPTAPQTVSPSVENELSYMLDDENEVPQQPQLQPPPQKEILKDTPIEPTVNESEKQVEMSVEEDFDSFDAELNSTGYGFINSVDLIHLLVEKILVYV